MTIEQYAPRLLQTNLKAPPHKSLRSNHPGTYRGSKLRAALEGRLYKPWWVLR